MNARTIELAGILTEKKWSGDVKTKWKPAEGFFTGSAAEIVSGLMAAGPKKAMSRLNFFINRAGKKLSDKDQARLEKAKEALEKKLAKLKEDIDSARRAAGMPLLEAKADDADAEPDMDLGGDEGAEGAEEDAPAKGKGKADEEEELPAIVTKTAKAAEGKDAEALESLLMKVYDAGVKAGKKEAAEEKAAKAD